MPTGATILPFSRATRPDAREGTCRPLSGAELRDLTRSQRPVCRSRGQIIVHEGDPAERLFAINAGVVALHQSLPDGRRQILAFLWKGDVIGIGDAECYGYTAEALTETRLCAFTRPDLERMMSDYPALGLRLAQIGMEGLSRAYNHMTTLGRRTAAERLAAFLLELSDRQGRCGGRRNPVWVPMDTTEIGDYLGLRIETVSRRMSAFLKGGLIRRAEAHHIDLLDRARLEEVAGGVEEDGTGAVTAPSPPPAPRRRGPAP